MATWTNLDGEWVVKLSGAEGHLNSGDEVIVTRFKKASSRVVLGRLLASARVTRTFAVQGQQARKVYNSHRDADWVSEQRAMGRDQYGERLDAPSFVSDDLQEQYDDH